MEPQPSGLDMKDQRTLEPGHRIGLRAQGVPLFSYHCRYGESLTTDLPILSIVYFSESCCGSTETYPRNPLRVWLTVRPVHTSHRPHPSALPSSSLLNLTLRQRRLGSPLGCPSRLRSYRLSLNRMEVRSPKHVT